MREIKFRVWDNSRKEWVHGPGDEVNLFGETILCGELLRRPDDTHISLDNLNHIIALQYTGLKDKNGKEIYEGDIINVDNSPCNCKVSWSDKYASFVLTREDWIFRHYFGEACPEDCEVIGNIYDLNY